MTADKPDAAPEDWVRRVLNQPGRPGRLEVEGRATTYLQWGDPDNARVMLLLHGFLGHAHWWDFVAPWFAQDYRVVAMDFAGMGDSDHRDHYAIECFADQVGALLHAIGVPVTLVGHSFGGRITLHTAQRYPQHLTRCMIVDSRIGFGSAAPPRARKPSRPKIIYPDLDTACARFRFRPDEPPVAPAIMRHLAHSSVRQAADGYAWKFDAALIGGIDWDLSGELEVLRSVDVPIDFISGELSRVVSLELAVRISAALKRGRGPVVIPAAHHHIPVNQPLALVAAMRALLA